MERHGVAMYFNGHDHNAQHLNDGSNVEYLVVGAGAPVDPSRGHKGDVARMSGGPEWPDKSGTCKFYWARTQEDRDACDEDPDCRFDTSVKDGSFAKVDFKNADEAEVEIITHNGEVVYSLTKPNPITRDGSPAGRYSSLDRTEENAEQKRYVPYKAATVAPLATPGNGAADSDGVGTVVLILLLVTAAAAGFVAKAPFCAPMREALCSKHAKVGADGGIYGEQHAISDEKL
jgi:hypothetical protein